MNERPPMTREDRDKADRLIRQRKDELREQKLAKGWHPNPARPIDDARIEIFLAELRKHANVTEAVKRASLHTTGYSNAWYALRKRNPAFAAAWDEAVKDGIGACEQEAHRRAVEGWDEEVTVEELVGDQMKVVKKTKTKRYSDRLLLARLSALDPKYRQRAMVEHGGTVEVKHAGLDKLSPKSRELVRLILEQEAQKAKEQEAPIDVEAVEVETSPALALTAETDPEEDLESEPTA